MKLFSVLSYQGMAAQKHAARALWRLEIRPDAPASKVVRTVEGETRLGAGAIVARVDFDWDGRNQAGRSLPAGRYLYTFKTRYLDDRLGAVPASDYAGAGVIPGAAEAYASTDEIVIDNALDTVTRPTCARAGPPPPARCNRIRRSRAGSATTTTTARRTGTRTTRTAAIPSRVAAPATRTAAAHPAAV